MLSLIKKKSEMYCSLVAFHLVLKLPVEVIG
jgi:hypothetical protein